MAAAGGDGSRARDSSWAFRSLLACGASQRREKDSGVGAVRAGPKVTVIVGIEHVQLAMPAGREADARRFYSGLLGIPEVAKPPALAKRGGALFESGAVKIHLGVEGDFRPARKAHPALLVRGLRAMIERLREAQAAVVEDPLEGYLRVYVADPFGNRIELMEREA